MGLKPYFNDFVVHKAMPSASTAAFSRALISRTASRLEGRTLWQRPAHPAADQDVLLLLSEEGELALVNATTIVHELARFPAIEGKPGITRTGRRRPAGSQREEMAAFRLSWQTAEALPVGSSPRFPANFPVAWRISSRLSRRFLEQRGACPALGWPNFNRRGRPAWLTASRNDLGCPWFKVFAGVFEPANSCDRCGMARRLPELTLECAIESRFRLVSDVGGDFRDASRCPFERPRAN